MNTDNRIAQKAQSGSAVKTTRLQTGLFDPCIKHNSNGLKETIAPEHLMAPIYGSSDMEERLKNLRNGKGFVTDAEAAIKNETDYLMIFSPECLGFSSATDWLLEMTPQEYSEYLQDKYDYVDDGASCTFKINYDDAENDGEPNEMDAPDGIGDTVSKDALNIEGESPALEQEAEQNTELTTKEQAQEPNAIEASADPSVDFNKAATAKQPDKQADLKLEQAPSEPLPTAPAANSSSYDPAPMRA